MTENDPIFFENLLIKFLYKKVDIREKVLPFLTTNLFDNNENKEVIKHLFSFLEEYKNFPNVKDTRLFFNDNSGTTDQFDKIMSIDETEYDGEFLLDELEKFIKEKLINNVCVDTVMLINDDKLNEAQNSPEKLRDAFSFCFDSKIGLDVFNSEEEIFSLLHEKRKITPTGIKPFDDMIDGGIPDKSLTLILGGTNIGKSLILSSMASSMILQNKNVLYISCELSDFEITKRVLANVMDVPVNNLRLLSRDKFTSKISKIKEQIKRKLIVKEYPSKSISANNIRNLLKDLKLKLKFEPDIIFLDQIVNLNSAYRTKTDNTYSEMGKVTQEVRGLSTEFGSPFVSAIQSNRKGLNVAEMDLSNTGDSLGFVQYADIVVAVTVPEEMKQLSKYMWMLLKNRFGLKDVKFPVNVIYEKMRVFDDEHSISTNINKNEPQTTVEKEKTIESAVEMLKNKINKNKETEEKNFFDVLF
jgi:KaiC/GvpD/RAD55 family RecA-like ATPase